MKNMGEQMQAGSDSEQEKDEHTAQNRKEVTAEPVYRDLLDKNLYKKEVAEINENIGDEEKREIELRELRFERALQTGAELFNTAEYCADADYKQKGEFLVRKAKTYFNANKIPLSNDQKMMLEMAGEIWDEKGQEVLDTLNNLPNMDTLFKAKIIQKPSNLKEWQDLINSKESEIIKLNLLKRLGDHIRFIPCQEDNSGKDVRIDLISNYPAIAVEVNNKDIWDKSGNKGNEGFFTPGENGIYIFTGDKTEEGIEKINKHEKQHWVRSNFRQKIINNLIAGKIDTKEFLTEDNLKKIEQQIGGKFDSLKHIEKDTSVDLGSVGDFLNKKKMRTLTKVGRDERDLWIGVQNELMSYLTENRQFLKIKRVAKFSPFIKEGFLEEIYDEKINIPKERFEKFDILHDLLKFYNLAGVDEEKLFDIVSTSSDFEVAIERIEKNFTLTDEHVKKAIDFEGFGFRNMEKVLDIIENKGNAESRTNQFVYFIKKLNQENISNIVYGLTEGVGHPYDDNIDITKYSKLQNEEHAVKVINQIVDTINVTCLNKEFLSINLGDLTDIVLTKCDLERINSIISIRMDLLKLTDSFPVTIRQFVLDKITQETKIEIIENKVQKVRGDLLDPEFVEKAKKVFADLAVIFQFQKSEPFWNYFNYEKRSKESFEFLEKFMQASDEKRNEILDIIMKKEIHPGQIIKMLE